MNTNHTGLTTRAALALSLGLALAGSAVAQDSTLRECSTAADVDSPATRNSLNTQLDILSWNIQKSSGPGWARDLARLSADTHLAFIQEAAVGVGIPAVTDSLTYRSFAAGYTSDSQQTGVMTLSAAAPRLSCNFKVWEPWLGTPKATSITTYAIRGRDDRLLAVNLHAVNFALGLTHFREQIHALQDLLADHRGPMVIAGDFNTWSDRRQQLVDDFLASHALQPVTFSPDNRTRVFGSALDHIYVRGMYARSAEAIEVSSSDHNPLRVSLEII